MDARLGQCLRSFSDADIATVLRGFHNLLKNGQDIGLEGFHVQNANNSPMKLEYVFEPGILASYVPELLHMPQDTDILQFLDDLIRRKQIWMTKGAAIIFVAVAELLLAWIFAAMFLCNYIDGLTSKNLANALKFTAHHLLVLHRLVLSKVEPDLLSTASENRTFSIVQSKLSEGIRQKYRKFGLALRHHNLRPFRIAIRLPSSIDRERTAAECSLKLMAGLYLMTFFQIHLVVTYICKEYISVTIWFLDEDATCHESTQLDTGHESLQIDLTPAELRCLCDWHGQNLLHLVCESSMDTPPGELEKLVDGGCDIEAKDQFGETPLDIAVRNGKTDYVEVLLRKGAQE